MVQMPIVAISEGLLECRATSLRQPSHEVESFGDELAQLVAAMKTTLHATEKGVALAAPQIGIQLRVFVVHLERINADQPEDRVLKHDVFVNPSVVNASKNSKGRETCLSVPGYYGVVKRATKVTVEAKDQDGSPFTVETHGFVARAILHEIDHLDGHLYIDRIESPDDLHRKGQENPSEEGSSAD